ncbi:Peroxisome biogenesis protein 22 [Diplonema papillatum]|nr:Peroxisome biogenesis protein 22 [Diplonema papillatum]
MGRRSSLLSQFNLDDTTAWLAVVVGMILMLALFRLKDNPRTPNANRTHLQPGPGQVPGKLTSIKGWKVLLCLDSVRDFSNGRLFKFAADQIPFMQKLAKDCNLHLVALVNNDEEEAAVKRAVEDASLEIAPHKVLCCDTIIGKQAVARQLAPSVYIETNEDVVNYIAQHLPHVGFITESVPGIGILPNTIVTSCPAKYVDKLLGKDKKAEAEAAAEKEVPTAQ